MIPYKKKGAADITPYLIVNDIPKLLLHLQKAFGARLHGKLTRPNGSLMHAEISIGDSLIMLGEPMGQFEPMPSNLFLYVADAAATISQALSAGGTLVMELTDMPHAGVRYGGVKDPSGNNWWIGTHLQDMSWQEQQDSINATAQHWSNE